ncbi:MAG: endonuclease NucS domain-containing protein [Gemmatimonadales bacterium]
MRDFMVAHLPRISVGGTSLRLYRDANGRSGREYPTDVGPIDILAVAPDGTLVVIELKLDRGPDRALGQLARYMGWVRANLSSGADVRGAVVARRIDEKLRYAAAAMPGILLLEYEVDFRVREVTAI